MRRSGSNATRRKDAGNRCALAVWDGPSPAGLDDLVTRLEAEAAPYAKARERKLREADARRRSTTVRSFAVAVARHALMTLPPRGGVPVAYGRDRYTGHGISADYLSEATKAWEAAGLIQVVGGFHDPAKKLSRVTRITPTEKFIRLARDSGLSLAQLRVPPDDVLILRGGSGTEVIPQAVLDSAEVIKNLNALNATVRLHFSPEVHARVIARISTGYWIDAQTGKRRKVFGGFDESSIFLARIFSGSWRKGGRIYGGFWINLPREERPNLLIDGRPTAEPDFRTLHPRMLYAIEGSAVSEGFDPYTVPGFEWVNRQEGKRTFARLLNSGFRAAAIKRSYLDEFPLKFEAEDRNHFASRDEFRLYVKAMRSHLSTIDQHFGKGYGLTLQNMDSEIAIGVLRKCVMSGIPTFPVHDSFIVKQSDAAIVESYMEEELEHMFNKISTDIH